MFDQAGMVRELVKWDYELRVPDQVGDVVRARVRDDDGAAARPGLSGAAARAAGGAGRRSRSRPQPRRNAASGHPDPRAIATLAEWIAGASGR